MKIKKLLSIFLAVIMVLGVCPVMNVFAAEERGVVDSGTCGAQGDNLKWTLFDDGELVISGEGEMDWYYPIDDKKLAPWNDFYDKIKVITIEEGVTSIGENAFRSAEYTYAEDEVAVYYKINLPMSLEFYEGNMPDSSAESLPSGSHLALCYPGDEEAWGKVKQKKFTHNYNKDTGEVEREFIETVTPGKIMSNPVDGFKKLYLNGEQPTPFCEIIGDEHLGELGYGSVRYFYAHYYIGELENANLKWYINGDSGRLKTQTNEEGLKSIAELKMFTHGKAEVTLKLESSEGMTLSVDTSQPIVSANGDRLNVFELIFVYVGGFFSEVFLLFSYGFIMLGALIGSIFS